MQVRYQARADRVLWQLRTHEGQLFAIWLTRRMLRQLWPPLQRLVAEAGVAQVVSRGTAPGQPPPTVLPEAREMLAQVARERPLPQADFRQPFDTRPAEQPLGAEPLLPEQIDLGPGTDGRGLALRLREPANRQLALQLSDDLATALLRLIEAALREADWGVLPPATPAAAAPAGPVVLN